MPESGSQGKAFLNNLVASATWSLLPSLATAMWQYVGHRSVDWWGIVALFAITCTAFWFSRKRTPKVQTQKLKILSAVYGPYKGKGVDVTEVLRGLLTSDTLAVIINNDLFGDPAIGKAKRLQVSYSYSSPAVVKIERRESDLMVLPEDTFLKEQADNNHAQEPTKHLGPPTAQELREQVLSLAGDLCGFLIGNGKPLDTPHVDDGFAGLGLPPDDPEIKAQFTSTFGTRIAAIKGRLGERGLLGEKLNFSSIGDALDSSPVRNAGGVREIIKCLALAAKIIEERFIRGSSFAFASGVSCADPTTPSRDDIFEVIWKLKEFHKSLPLRPEVPAMVPDLTAENADAYAAQMSVSIKKWSDQIRHSYEGTFSSKVSGLMHKLGSMKVDVSALDEYSKRVETDEDVSNVIEALQKIASGLEGK